jgi:hypothetical protein
MPKALEIIAIVFSAMYFGSTVYVAFVELPASLACSSATALAHWTQTLKLTPRYASSALVAAAAAILYGKASLSSPWTWGSILSLTVVPFTALALLPIQRRLTAPDWDPESIDTRQRLIQWGWRHAVRTLLGSCAFALFLWAALRA